MRLPRRRILWLSAVLLLAVVVGVAWLLLPRSQITRANFDRIQEGMNWEEVWDMIGPPRALEMGLIPVNGFRPRCWENGPNWIWVDFVDDKVQSKDAHFATAWETLIWYAKKGAAKIGVKWD
jgi:hypothetical protein